LNVPGYCRCLNPIVPRNFIIKPGIYKQILLSQVTILRILSKFVFRIIAFIKSFTFSTYFMISRFTFLCSLMFAISANCVQAQYIYTFAGNGYGAATGVGSYTGDGHQARSAELNSCTGVGYDGAGNIFIADRANNVIRKVAVTGIITTYAGKDSAGYSGDNGYSASAKLNKPYSVVADVSGNIYISDGGNNVIRKVSVTNVITTIAGTGTAAFSGDGGQATAAELNGPQGIAIDSFGNLYIADTYNNRIRKILPNGIILTVAGNSAGSY